MLAKYQIMFEILLHFHFLEMCILIRKPLPKSKFGQWDIFGRVFVVSCKARLPREKNIKQPKSVWGQPGQLRWKLTVLLYLMLPSLFYNKFIHSHNMTVFYLIKQQGSPWSGSGASCHHPINIQGKNTV